MLLAFTFNWHLKKLLTSSRRTSIFNAEFPGPFPNQIDSLKIESATDHVLYRHLVRTLVSKDDQGMPIPNLALAWRVDDAGKEYDFTIDPRARWSNGKLISAEEVARHFQKGQDRGQTTHVDFRRIDRVLVKNGHVLVVLKKTDPNFLNELAQPEAGIVLWGEGSQSGDYAITSGAYSLGVSDIHSWHLKANSFFPSAIAGHPTDINFVDDSGGGEKLSALSDGRLDFIFPRSDFPLFQIEQLKSNPQIQTISFPKSYSYWISLVASRPIFSDQHSRQWVAGVISRIPFEMASWTPRWTRARMLSSDQVVGRASLKEVEAIGRTHQSVLPNKIPLLQLLVADNFPFLPQLIEGLKQAGIDVALTRYASIAEFGNLLRTRRFDAFEINNDFSSPDVLESFSVAFSEARPLIDCGSTQKDFEDKLKLARSAPNLVHRATDVKDLELDLLRSGCIVPIAYLHSLAFASRRWSYSAWSKNYQDLRFWNVGYPGGVDQ